MDVCGVVWGYFCVILGCLGIVCEVGDVGVWGKSGGDVWGCLGFGGSLGWLVCFGWVRFVILLEELYLPSSLLTSRDQSHFFKGQEIRSRPNVAFRPPKSHT